MMRGLVRGERVGGECPFDLEPCARGRDADQRRVLRGLERHAMERRRTRSFVVSKAAPHAHVDRSALARPEGRILHDQAVIVVRDYTQPPRVVLTWLATSARRAARRGQRPRK
jgi:hypothetical protein